MEQIATDQLILTYLDQHPGVPPRQIAKALHICVSDVRYHLQKLRKAGEVSRVEVELTHQPGRPAGLYQTVKQTDPSLLSLLMNGVFTVAQDYPNFIPAVALNLLPADVFQAATPSIRILKTVQYFNSLGYDARWESRPDHPWVELRKCPYSCMENKTSYCQLDLALLESGTGFIPKQIQASTPKSHASCLFSLE